MAKKKKVYLLLLIMKFSVLFYYSFSCSVECQMTITDYFIVTDTTQKTCRLWRDMWTCKLKITLMIWKQIWLY